MCDTNTWVNITPSSWGLKIYSQQQFLLWTARELTAKVIIDKSSSEFAGTVEITVSGSSGSKQSFTLNKDKSVPFKFFLFRICIAWVCWIDTLSLCIRQKGMPHVCVKSPYPVRNPGLGFFLSGSLVLGLICLLSQGASVVRCHSWHHQWPWWDSNPRHNDYEPQALPTEPRQDGITLPSNSSIYGLHT